MLDFIYKVNGGQLKLKLEAQGETTVLSVMDLVSASDVQILKAGLNKLIRSGKKSIILDLSNLPETSFQPREVVQEISLLKSWASEIGGTLGIKSPLADFAEADESELSKLLAQESRLKTQIDLLMKRRAEAEQKVSAVSSGGTDLRSLRQENSALESLIHDYEQKIRLLLPKKTTNFEDSAVQSKSVELMNILLPHLQKDGLVPAGGKSG